MAHRHLVRPRYGEIDMQQVVFNAHYLAYCDDAADLWFRAIDADLEGGGWDVMVKKVVVTWSGAARLHDYGTPPPASPAVSTRIGLSTGADLPWRWCTTGSLHLSKPS